MRLSLKRLIDIFASIALLLLLAPLMTAIAALIKLTSPGPVIFRQRRVGLHGRLFTLYKFRTMVVGAEAVGAGYYMDKDDPRITRIGRVLRTYSLDELPELWNVLKGDMSLVGPRPTLPYQVDMYTASQKRRLLMRPGITGLAQVNGRNDIPWSARIAFDLQYIENWSLLLDFRILAKTVLVVVTHRGVRHDQAREEVEDLGRGGSSVGGAESGGVRIEC